MEVTTRSDSELLSAYDAMPDGGTLEVHGDELRRLEHALQRREDASRSYARRQELAKTRPMRFANLLAPFLGRRDDDIAANEDRVKHRRLRYGASIYE